MCRNIITATDRLQETIGPGSLAFRSGDLLRLRKGVADVLDFADGARKHLSFDQFELRDLENDIRLARRGIVQDPLLRAPGQNMAEENMEQLPTEEEHAAAVLIQNWYRAARRDRSSSVDPILAKNLASCANDVANIQHPGAFLDHRQTYMFNAAVRGSLPHALCALDRILPGAIEAKSVLLRKLLTVKHQELEVAYETMDALM